MTDTKWAAVDEYLNALHIGVDPVLDGAVAASVAAGLPPIAVAPNQGKLLHLLVDADKKSIPEYFEWALKLSRPGALIIVDNVIRDGNVVNADSTDADIQGIRRFNEMLVHEPRVIVTTLQTVGSKGYDELAFVLVTS